jgi:hypothetical protein
MAAPAAMVEACLAAAMVEVGLEAATAVEA